MVKQFISMILIWCFMLLFLVVLIFTASSINNFHNAVDTSGENVRAKPYRYHLMKKVERQYTDNFYNTDFIETREYYQIKISNVHGAMFTMLFKHEKECVFMLLRENRNGIIFSNFQDFTNKIELYI